jgi:hypothetical protein
MTKATANEIKKAIRKAGLKNEVLYRSTDETFRINVGRYYDETVARMGREAVDKGIKEKIQKVLVALQNAGLRPRFEIETIRYQGFINTVNLKFK